MSFERIFEKFGQAAFGYELFQIPNGHRFTLAAGESYLERFRTALDRSRQLLHRLFCDSNRLMCVIVFYSGERYG